MQQRDVKITEPKAKTYLIDDTEKAISVCAYCRVSTDKSDQRNSFTAQKRFFTSEFSMHPNWVKKTIFADKGISGTSLEKRDEFNRMVAAALNGEYDLIITKEVSRFSRNVKDILNTVTELHDRGIYIWFLTDDINTEDADYREKLVEAGKQAEAESRKTSRRVKWGQRLQMERGVVFGRKEMYGYNIKRDTEGKQFFEIIENEAKVVRQIFEMYANGKGTFQIANYLKNQGVETKRFASGWSNTVILRILRNEKYVGDLTTGKTYTPDCLDHKKKYNRGDSALITITNHHPESAIISRELWDKVQQMLKEKEPNEETKAKHSNRYWCSGKVFCGECGQRFVSHTKKQKSGNIVKSWKCWNNQQYGSEKVRVNALGEEMNLGCNCTGVNDRILKQGVNDIITQLIKPDFTSVLKRIRAEFENTHKIDIVKADKQIAKLQAEIEVLNDRITKLTEGYTDGTIPQIAYTSTMKKQETEMQRINNEISKLTALKNENKSLSSEIESKLADLQKIVNLQDNEINEDVFRNVVDKIEVYKNHILKFYFYALPEPITMQYTTSGRKETYTAHFTILK